MPKVFSASGGGGAQIRQGRRKPGRSSQLGIGVTIPEPEVFAERYVEASQNLQKEFDLDYATPFFSSTCLKDHLNIFEAADFANRLVSMVQEHIESVHCSYIALPTTGAAHVEVGDVRCAKQQMPAVKFIDSLGPMFSYLTALSYIWEHKGSNFGDLEMHIDSFRSRHTKGWSIVKKTAPIKVFYKGDECNPFISCADIIAFLVDDTLVAKRLRLFPDDIKSTLESYRFGKTVHFFWFTQPKPLRVADGPDDQHIWPSGKAGGFSGHRPACHGAPRSGGRCPRRTRQAGRGQATEA